MPKTKKQGIVFGLMTAFVMVFVMATYMVAVPNGFHAWMIVATLKDMWIEFIVAFFLAGNLMHPYANKLADKVCPAKDNGKFTNHVVGGVLTVCFMVPCMTLLASCLHGGFNATLFDRWINSIALAFPMALACNLLIAGPLVNFVFAHLINAYSKIKK